MNTLPDLAFSSLDVMTVFDPVTGDFWGELDELTNASIKNTQEEQDITGGGGRLLNTLKKNKGATVSGTNGLISGSLLELQTGGKLESRESTPIMYREYITITDDKSAITYKAVGAEGNEISKVYIRNTDGTPAAKLTQGATADNKTFAFNPDTKELTFATGKYPDGTTAVVYYKRNVKGGFLANNSGKFSKKARVYIDATYEDRCANVYRVQFFFPLGDFSGTFDMDMGDSQMVHNFEFKSLATSCINGTPVTKGDLWTYTVFGANAEDSECDGNSDDGGTV